MKISIIEIVFWTCFAAVAYTYICYPILLFLLALGVQAVRDISYLIARRDRRMVSPLEFLPRVALLVSAHNEEDVIEAKLQNTRKLRYPSDRLELLLGLDAPTDSTADRAIGNSFPGVRIFNFPTRRGKLAVLHDLARETSAELLVFSDANTMLAPDCIRALVRHFIDPRVGAVGGDLQWVCPGTKIVRQPLYWRYELGLKILESRLNCLVGAIGAIYAVRSSLFRPGREWIIEDFQVAMEIRFSGWRVVYDPEALAFEDIAPTVSSEFQRRTRIGAGDFQTLFRNPRFLNPFKGLPAFAYLSHKVLRWLAPLFLIGTLCSNVLLGSHTFYAGVLAAQAIFYLLAISGSRWQGHEILAKLLSVPLHFCLMNLALLLGMFRFLSGRQEAVWSVTPRRVAAEVMPAKREGYE